MRLTPLATPLANNVSQSLSTRSGRHARAAGDPLLAGSEAAMRSAVAFFGREFDTAADIAVQAQARAHPYIVPMLACAQARAFALAGRQDEARSALRTMGENIWTGKQVPGLSPIDDETYEAFSAVILGYLGAGEEAEPHARRSLTMLAHSGRYRSTAGTHLALARASVHRRHPDPEQAARAAVDAVATIDGREVPDGPTVGRAAGLWCMLVRNNDWARLASVRDLGDQVSSGRHALPPGPTI